jgi:GntR family transcriptional regulator
VIDMAPARKLPKYRQLADELRRQIRTYQLLPGMMLPTEPELAAAHGYSRQTVREALAVLRNEGLILSGKGRGTQVRPAIVRNDISLDDYARDLEAYRNKTLPSPLLPGADPNTKREPSREVLADENLAYWFGIDEGVPLWRREAVVSAFGRPRWVIVSFFPMSLVEGTPLADPDNQWPAGRTAVLAELLSIQKEPTRVAETEVFSMPSADEVDRLRILGADCMVRITRQVWSGDDVAEVAHSIDYQGSQIRTKNSIDLR